MTAATKEVLAETALYRPIADYAVIGDSRSLALVSRLGSVDWMCLPDFHSPSVFAALLDSQAGGRLALGPAGETEVSRRYEDGGAVLITEFSGPDGRFRLTDFMLVTDVHPGGMEPERQLIRIVDGLEGAPEVDLTFEPRPGYGRRPVILRDRGALGWSCESGGHFHLLRTDLEAALDGRGTVKGRTAIRAGERRSLSFSFSRRDIGIIPALGQETEDKRRICVEWWREWSNRCRYDGPYAEEVGRSLVTLRLLNFVQSGAVVAAGTTSLPESLEGGRNWDYRYCWLRDAGFIMRAFMRLGYPEEGRSFLSWLMHATNLTAPHLQTIYDIYGRTALNEQVVESLEGWRGVSPVNSGNGAAGQLQLDVYGAVISAAREYVEHGGELGWSERRRLANHGRVVMENWRRPDNGIWEIRGGRKHTTYSKCMCWSALNDLLFLESRGVIRTKREPAERERDLIRDTVLRDAWSDELGAFAGALGQHYLDASLLLMPRMGIIEPHDRRMEATYEQVAEKLSPRFPLLRRYAKGVDGMGSVEGAFVACGFWAIDYLARAGRVDEARQRMDAHLAYANDLGLFSEEVHPETGELLGNFPQAFSHTGIINAALQIAAAEGKEPS